MFALFNFAFLKYRGKVEFLGLNYRLFKAIVLEKFMCKLLVSQTTSSLVNKKCTFSHFIQRLISMAIKWVLVTVLTIAGGQSPAECRLNVISKIFSLHHM